MKGRGASVGVNIIVLVNENITTIIKTVPSEYVVCQFKLFVLEK